MLPILPDSIPVTTCKLGQGPNCCRYLAVGGEGFVCAKMDAHMKATLDHRANSGEMVAVGDNCSGWVEFGTKLGQA